MPGVNNLGTYGRWAFVELTELYCIEADFEAKLEEAFGSMIEHRAAVAPDPLADLESAAAEAISRHLADVPELLELSREIWSTIRRSSDGAFQLADLTSRAARDERLQENALAVLGLLSSQEVGLLRMKLVDQHVGSREVEPAELVRRLTDWHRNKTMNDAEWQRWASQVQVSWVPAIDPGSAR